MTMQMTTGDIIAIAAVSLNALVYLSGFFKLNETVKILSVLTEKLESTMHDVSNRLIANEKAVSILERNCVIYHGQQDG